MKTIPLTLTGILQISPVNDLYSLGEQLQKCTPYHLYIDEGKLKGVKEPSEVFIGRCLLDYVDRGYHLLEKVSGKHICVFSKPLFDFLTVTPEGTNESIIWRSSPFNFGETESFVEDFTDDEIDDDFTDDDDEVDDEVDDEENTETESIEYERLLSPKRNTVIPYEETETGDEQEDETTEKLSESLNLEEEDLEEEVYISENYESEDSEGRLGPEDLEKALVEIYEVGKEEKKEEEEKKEKGTFAIFTKDNVDIEEANRIRLDKKSFERMEIYHEIDLKKTIIHSFRSFLEAKGIQNEVQIVFLKDNTCEVDILTSTPLPAHIIETIENEAHLELSFTDMIFFRFKVAKEEVQEGKEEIKARNRIYNWDVPISRLPQDFVGSIEDHIGLIPYSGDIVTIYYRSSPFAIKNEGGGYFSVFDKNDILSLPHLDPVLYPDTEEYWNLPVAQFYTPFHFAY